MGITLIVGGLIGFVFWGIMSLPLIPRESENYFSEGMRVYGRVLWKVSLAIAGIGGILLFLQ